MKEMKTNRVYFLIGLTLLALGGTVLTGWIISSATLTTFFTHKAPLGFFGVWSVIFSGFLFIAKSFNHPPITTKIKFILATLVIINSLLIVGFCLSGFSPYVYFFPTGQFIPYFAGSHNIISHLAWALAGFLMCHATHTPNTKHLAYLETINFILLFLGIQGIVQSLHKFELVYTWLNNFAMPLPYAIGLTIVNIGMIVVWNDIRSSCQLHGDEEDRQIRFFSISMLTQAIMSSVFFGAMMLASQNELFLRTSLEKNVELKSLVLNDTINNEILEVQRALKVIDDKLTQRKAQPLNERNIPDLNLLLSSQAFSAAQITNTQGAKLLTQGTFITDSRDTLLIPGISTTKLIRDNGWSIYFKNPIQVNSKTVGFIELQKPIKGLDDIINTVNKFSPSEIKVICSQSSDGSPHCLSSNKDEDSEWAINALNPFTIKSSIGQAFINKGKNNRNNITIVENLKDINLRFAIMIDSDEIEKDLRHQMYIAIPIIGLFILFFMRMLNWHIIPIFRRSANAEKDAIDSARMVSDSESRIRTIVDNIGECVIVFSEDGKIDSMNQTALTTFGLSDSLLKNSNITNLLNTDIDDFQKYMYTAYGQWRDAIGRRTDESTFNALIKFKDIKTRHRHLFIAIIRDVTDQKNFENKLAQSEKVFRNSFDHAPIGMMVLNMKNKIIQVNQSLCAMLGYHESELIGSNLKLILPDYLRQENSLPFQKLAEIGIKNYSIESPMLTKSGDIIHTASSMTLFLSTNEDDCFFVAQIQDETIRQRYEAELRQTNEELQNKFKELKTHTRITEELNRMNGILQSCLTIAEALNPIEKFAEKLFEDIQGAVYLNTPENTGHMELALRWGESNDNVDLLKTDDCWALRRSQPYIADNTHEQITCYHYENSIIEGQICIPLTAQGELIGLITLYSIDENFQAHYQDLTRLALSFADHIALSLSNIKLRERLQHQSIIDALTNLYNRRYFDETMKIELSRSERKNTPLSLLIVDIDHFKKFNDTYGHDIGDIVLQEVSGVLKKNVRASDIACRMGGEEFAIVMPDASTEVAHERAEILRKAISKIIIKNAGKKIAPITASVGIATYPEHASTTKLLIESADMALYAAKNNGRNRCITATALTALGSLKEKPKSRYSAKET